MTPQEEALAQAIAAHQLRLTGTMHGCGPGCSLAILDALPEGCYLHTPETMAAFRHRWRLDGAQQERERLRTLYLAGGCLPVAEDLFPADPEADR